MSGAGGCGRLRGLRVLPGPRRGAGLQGSASPTPPRQPPAALQHPRHCRHRAEPLRRAARPCCFCWCCSCCCCCCWCCSRARSSPQARCLSPSKLPEELVPGPGTAEAGGALPASVPEISWEQSPGATRRYSAPGWRWGSEGLAAGGSEPIYWEAPSPLLGGREAKRAAPARPASLGGTRRPPSAARGRGHRPLVRMVRAESWGGLEQLWAAQGCSEHWGPGATRVAVAAGPWGQRRGAPAVPSASCHQHGALKPACRSSGAGQRRAKQPRGLGCVWLGCQH